MPPFFRLQWPDRSVKEAADPLRRNLDLDTYDLRVWQSVLASTWFDGVMEALSLPLWIDQRTGTGGHSTTQR